MVTLIYIFLLLVRLSIFSYVYCFFFNYLLTSFYLNWQMQWTLLLYFIDLSIAFDTTDHSPPLKIPSFHGYCEIPPLFPLDFFPFLWSLLSLFYGFLFLCSPSPPPTCWGPSRFHLRSSLLTYLFPVDDVIYLLVLPTSCLLMTHTL